ncbi:cytochrome C [Sulfuricella sp. T08]|uniref:c-type cytochrome n=1 Tax=Sulfuricella sp. T08 TaxID=1632857 RepID=UPI000617A0EB|nr:c-type cytochrome [Sulfuricella sp. T08]GAO36755.1 cytochrome C [Sulfuricella sp. T08]
MFGKSTNYLYLIMVVVALSPMGGIAADKPVDKTSAKKTAKTSVKKPAAETSEPASTNKPVATHISAAIAALKADPETGRQINGVCAACHGDSGQGGKKGEYPRLAGQHVEYLMDQLHKFKDRKRTNLPMFPYTEERELPDEDLVHIAAYLASIKLDTTFPVFKESDDALTRLLAVEKVLNIPRSEGDVDAGAKIYKTECSSCHKKDGMGHKTVPMLAGQYTTYLKRQIDKFIKGERIHDEEMKDPSKDVLNLLKPEEIRDILAYLTTLDD